jgi:hypothetical protein
LTSQRTDDATEPQSIRDYLQRRARRAFAVAAAGLLLTPLAVVFGPLRLIPVVVAIGALTFGGGLLYAMRLRCPRCGTRLGQFVLLISSGYRSLIDPVRFCPYCGTSIDAPYDPTKQ